MVAWYFVSNELNELAYFSSKSSSFNHMHSRSRTIIGSHDGSINETVQIIVVAFNYHHHPNPNPRVNHGLNNNNNNNNTTDVKVAIARSRKPQSRAGYPSGWLTCIFHQFQHRILMSSHDPFPHFTRSSSLVYSSPT